MKLKRAGILTKIIFTVLLIYVATTLIGLYSQVSDAERERDKLLSEIDALKSSNAETRYVIDNSDDPAVLEGIARDELDLAYPDEDIYHRN